jgi:hypothetical protein
MNLSSSTQRIVGGLLRRIPLIFYISWVFVGYRLLNENRQLPLRFRYLATGDFAANHLLRPEDFRVDHSLADRDRIWLADRGDLVGKYIGTAIGRGQEIQLSNLRPNPVTIPSPGHLAYLFSLQHQASMAQVANAGSKVIICGAKCDDTDVEVLALLCSATKKDDCSLVLDLAPAQAVLVADPAKVQLALR